MKGSCAHRHRRKHPLELRSSRTVADGGNKAQVIPPGWAKRSPTEHHPKVLHVRRATHPRVSPAILVSVLEVLTGFRPRVTIRDVAEDIHPRVSTKNSVMTIPRSIHPRVSNILDAVEDIHPRVITKNSIHPRVITIVRNNRGRTYRCRPPRAPIAQAPNTRHNATNSFEWYVHRPDAGIVQITEATMTMQ